MVNIVTGPINSGKTSKLIKIYNDSNKGGDGFVSIKKMENNFVEGYDIMRLSSKLRKQMIIRKDYITNEWKESCTIGSYSFSEPAINYVENSIRLLMKQNVSPIFLDEIGLLELQNKCFHTIFRELIFNGCNLFIGVRKDYLKNIIEKYVIKNTRIYYP